MNRNNGNNNNNVKTPNKNVPSKGQNPNKTTKAKRKTSKVKSKSDLTVDDVRQKSIGKDVESRGSIIPTSLDDDRPTLKNLGRSSSFFLTRKISKLFNTITGSKENINEIKEEKHAVPPTLELPFKFTRSRSMISLRKSSRRSVLEAPQLEKLSEEAEHAKSSESTGQEPPPSPSILGSLKRALSSSSDKRRSSVNPRWSASLQNLQEIDNMVSYEDLSFVNYDRFNEYEKQLERKISQQDLTIIGSEMPPPVGNQVIRRRKKSDLPRKLSTTSLINLDGNFDQRKNLFRQSIEGDQLQHINDVQRNSFRWSQGDEVDSVVLRNYPNLIREDSECESIKRISDGRKELSIKRMNSNDPQDHVVVPKIRRRSVAVMEKREEEDLRGSQKLKSKSLTDLDILDSITCQRNSTDDSQKQQQVSSSEYFSVTFCTSTDRQEDELIPAVKGTSLFDALIPALKKRNLSFSQIAVFQSYNEPTSSPPYTSSLDESTDVEILAGKHLIISDRDASKRPSQLQKAASFGARTRPPRLLSSASTEETTESEQKSIPGKQLKQRWSGLFGMKNNQQQNQLCQLLDDYNFKGVPQKVTSVNFQQPDYQKALDYLHTVDKSWRDFVYCDGMSDTDIKVQSAIWELVTTEIDYIHVLKTVTDLFLACLDGIQDTNLLIDVDQHKLFSNIYDIYEANVQFWSHYLYPMVEHSKETHSPLSIDFFQEGFINFAINFAPYKKYCAEQSTCQFYCKELNRTNPLFTYYLTWCEAQKMCNRLRLADILVRPMQRLTKYSLLLLAVRKHIADENDGDNMDAMIHSVENFVCSVNTHLTTRQENERLKGIMARIESYDVVDSNNEQLDKITKQYSTMFDLCSPIKGVVGVAPGRHLFMEGDLKFKDNLGKSDVHCFLLTDILLICKTIAKKGQGTLKVIRQPFITDRLIVKHKDNILYCVYLNEFQMAVNAFTLQCTEAKSWYDAMSKARHIYARLKQGTSWDGYNLRHTNSGSFNNADTLSIKKSPINSSIGSRVSSLNNSHSGSVELNDSRNISVDFEKTNSLSSDEGSFMSCNQQTTATKPKTLLTSPHKLKTTSSNQLAVQPHSNLGQSLPNLNMQPSQTSNLYHTYSNNTLLVPGSSHSGYLLLSPSHRGISYPPPSPTRATLRRGFAFSSSIKNPPLVKTRNITSQNSFNLPGTIGSSGTQTQMSLQQSQQQSIISNVATPSLASQQQQQQVIQPSSQQKQLQQQKQMQHSSSSSLQASNESDV